jgi:hypothetical protein
VLLHWDGVRWTAVLNKGCGVCTITGLRGVTAISPTDAWAVGGRMGHTLIERWDGQTWSVS